MNNEHDEQNEQNDANDFGSDPDVPIVRIPAPEHPHHPTIEAHHRHHYIKRSIEFIRERWPSSSWLNAIASLTTAMATVVMVGVYLQIKTVMNSQGTQTDQLIEAAEIQAQASRRIADAARRQARAASSFAETADTAVEEFRKAAKDSTDASRKLAKNTEDTITNAKDSFREDQRAWIGIGPQRLTQFEENKPIRIELDISNSGKTPALNIEHWSDANFSSITSLGPMPSTVIANKWSPGGAVPPQGHQILYVEVPLEFTRQIFPIVHFKNSNYLSVFGEIVYHDTSGRLHTTQYCIFLPNPDTREFRFCDRWNEMN